MQVSAAVPSHNSHIAANMMFLVQCFNSTVNEQKTVALTALVTVLDILSDIMGKFSCPPACYPMLMLH